MDKIGSYKLVRLIDGSGTVELYEATDERLGRGLRLRVLKAGASEEEKSAFEEAARNEAQSASPSGSLHELGRTADGRPYAVYGAGKPGYAASQGEEKEAEPTLSARPARTSRRGLAIAIASAAIVIVAAAGVLVLLSLRGKSAGAEVPTLAIMDFSGTGLETDEAYLPSSLAGTIKSGFARLHGLRVAADGVVAEIAGSTDRAATAREYHVGFLVEGSITRSGGADTVKAVLSDAAGGKALWSVSVDMPKGKPLGAAARIADGIRTELGIAWRDTGEQKSFASVFKDPEVLALNELANSVALSGTTEAKLRSIDLYRRSLALDPAQLGVLRTVRTHYSKLAVIDAGNAAAYREEADKVNVAMQGLLEKEGVDPYWAAILASDEATRAGNPGDAAKELRRALAVIPGDFRATMNLGMRLTEGGKLKEAIELYEGYLARDPFEIGMGGVNLSYFLFLAGRYGEGYAAASKWLAWQPDEPDLLENAGMNLLALGRNAEAAALAGKAVAGGYANCEYLLAASEAASGKTAGPKEAADRNLAAMAEEGPSAHVLLVYKALGLKDEFFVYAKKALSLADDGGCALLLAYLPLIGDWRSDPRFAGLREANPIKGPDVL